MYAFKIGYKFKILVNHMKLFLAYIVHTLLVLLCKENKKKFKKCTTQELTVNCKLLSKVMCKLNMFVVQRAFC